MKKKNLISIFVLFVLFFLQQLLPLYSQEKVGNLELAVFNQTGNPIEIMLYPISGIINGDDRYTLVAKGRGRDATGNWYSYDYTSGVCYKSSNNEVFYWHPIQNNAFGGYNDDSSEYNMSAFGNYGWGNYKLVIRNYVTGRYDSCLIQFDWVGNYLPWSTPGDLYFYIYPDNVKPRFTYKFDRSASPPNNEIIEITYEQPNSYTARSWQPNGVGNNLNARDKKFGPGEGFKCEDFLGSGYDIPYFPVDARRDCGIIWPANNFTVNQNYWWYEGENNYYTEDRQGVIPLDLTIKKRVITPPDQINEELGANSVISVEPDVVFSIDKLSASDRGFYLNPFTNGYGNDIIVRSRSGLYPERITTLKLNSSEGADNNARLFVNRYCSVTIGSNAKLFMGNYSQIKLNNTGEVGGKMTFNQNSNVEFNPYSEITVMPYAELRNKGANIVNNTGTSTLTISQNGKYILEDNVTHTFDKGARLIINGGTLEIGNNSELVFDGAASYFHLDGNSTVRLGTNAKIEFKNGAYLDADGVTFSGLNGATWNSIVMENAGASTIKNCAFLNATLPVNITNTNSTGANSSKIISSNRFNPSLSHCVYAENVKNMLFENNNVYPSPTKVGLYIKNHTSFASDDEATSPSSDNIVIKNNTFYDGYTSMILACYTSGYTSFTVLNNTFNGYNVSFNFIGRYMGGDFKSNRNNITPSSNKCIQLTQSAPNMFGNTLTSGQANIYNDASYPKMAPLIQNGQFVWTGGYNQLNCTQSNNINFLTGIAKLDYGHNCFSRQDISKFHLVGPVNSENDQYFVRDNSFNSSPLPSYSLIDAITGNPVVAIHGNQYLLCNTPPSGATWLLQDRGFGIIDSVMVSTDNSGVQPTANVQLYDMAEQNILQNNYTEAIDEFKVLINNYPASNNLNSALYDLYRCYEGLDTSALQSHRNLIYGDLKTYLDNKILAGLYSTEFTDIAYNITLMCLVNMLEYDESKTGYEFIALYHPDAYIRLMASWDYAEVDNLINGAGGESDNKELISDEKYMGQLEKKFEKMIPKNPVLNKVKEIYDSKRNEKYDKLDKQYKNATSKDKEEIEQAITSLKSEDEKYAAKVTSVLRSANKMKPEERSKRQIEDLVMTSENQIKTDKELNNSIPLSYQLMQNYPNPFNPITKINFAIPKQGYVNLKVYDILGREVKTLINEIKQAGNYSVDFNASELSSGIYFYKLESNEFTDIKKMVLIK